MPKSFPAGPPPSPGRKLSLSLGLLALLFAAAGAVAAPWWQLVLWLRLPLQAVLALWIDRVAIARRR